MLGPLGEAERRVTGLVQPDARRGARQDLAGAADQLAAHQERQQCGADAAHLGGPVEQVVLVAPVGVADRVGVVLEQVDLGIDRLLGQRLLGLLPEFVDDPLPRPVVGHELPQPVAFGGRVLGVRAHIEVEAGAVVQEDVRAPPAFHDGAEQVARDLVGAERAATLASDAGDPELGLDSDDAPLHGLYCPPFWT